MNFIITLLILFLVLGIIILVHEFGHFIAAKKSGVYVEEFSLGMGPLIWSKKPKKSETTYSLRALPIGGYVAMAEKYDSKLKIKKERVLENKGFFSQLWVFANGIIFNGLLAIFLFFISGLIYGKPVSEPVVSLVVENSIAYNAGIQTGDRITKVNGVKIDTLDDFILEAAAKKLQDEYVFEVQKQDGHIQKYVLTPEVKKQDGQEVRSFGIAFSKSKHYKGIKYAFSYAVTGFLDNTKVIIKILGSLFNGKVSMDSLSGPVGMYTVVDQVKFQGFENIFYLIAYLSINVGIVNLLPIPVFDGGRILILFIEKISHKKSSEKLELTLNYIGFALMILLMLYVTYNDIFRLVVG